jgi:hypothetical protein
VKLSHKHIAPFLQSHQGPAAKILSYCGLGIGILLLLCSVQMYININYLLKEKSPKKAGFDFLSVTKIVTNDNMGNDNRFTPADIAELSEKPFVDGVAPLLSNQFKVLASAGNMIPFSTDLFLESIDNTYIDTVPLGFKWELGQHEIPIIVSADFLEMYNVFAPGWDLPQLSEKTVTTINLVLRCTGNKGEETFKARVVALSDRINSILVPRNFIEWANLTLEGKEQKSVSRVFLKTSDASNTALLSFLQEKGYHVNKDKTKSGRVKQVLQAIVSGLAGFGILVILLAMVLFSFYLKLMITRSRENLQLLLMLGYSASWLSKTVARKWIPVYIVIVIAAVLLTALLQYLFAGTLVSVRDTLPLMLNPVVIAVAMVLLLLSIVVNYRMVKQLLSRL